VVFGTAAIVACAHPQPPPRPAQQPALRVGVVVGAPRVTIGGRGRITAFAGGAAQFQVDNRQVTIAADGRVLIPDGSATTRYERLVFTSADPGGSVSVNGRRYRGTVELYTQGGALTAVNRVQLEDYLAGVVSAEMGRRAPNEAAALSAQAIVSRTYALRNQGRYASQGFDLTGGVADQAYSGVDGETPEGTAAVRSTAGMVLTYDGRLALAFFHSTCGFATATPSEAFRGIANVPYLRSVSDRKPGGGYYCDISPRFRWTVEWDGTTLRDILRRTLNNVLGISAETVNQIRDVRVVRTGPSGRATEVRIAVGRGEIPVFGPDIRAVLQTPEGRPLGSSAVQLHPESEGDTLTRLVVAGAGWGHGVGLCQWGAVGRARAGQSYQQILAAYFPGTKIERWY
jgi:stage II sporulation protein D